MEFYILCGGLGHEIVNEFISQMKDKISVKKSQNKYTIFTVQKQFSEEVLSLIKCVDPDNYVFKILK